jgi:ribosome-associated protein
MPQSDAQQPDEYSRGQRKRDMLELQKLGEELLKLSNDQLNALELPETLLAALLEAKRLKSHEGKRRQLQYIGKIMREVDAEPIRKAMKQIKSRHVKETQQFHDVEEWRERMIVHGDDAVNAFIEHYPATDRQQLRQLVRNARHDRNNNKNTGAEKSLFQFLRDIVG